MAQNFIVLAIQFLLASAFNVRWDLPSRPIDDKFISVADGAGLIFHKSMWVFQDSVRTGYRQFSSYLGFSFFNLGSNHLPVVIFDLVALAVTYFSLMKISH